LPAFEAIVELGGGHADAALLPAWEFMVLLNTVLEEPRLSSAGGGLEAQRMRVNSSRRVCALFPQKVIGNSWIVTDAANHGRGCDESVAIFQ